MVETVMETMETPSLSRASAIKHIFMVYVCAQHKYWNMQRDVIYTNEQSKVSLVIIFIRR